MSDTQTMLPTVEIALRTDPGRDPEKQVNEDSATHAETKHGLLAIVCDGMGGHAGGKEASELAVKTIVEIVEAAPAATPAGAALKRAIEEANAKVWAMPTAEAGFRPGSTVVALIAHPDGIEVAHVGDSRLYLVHAGAVSQVTRDHSMVQEMVDRNLIRAEDAATHPDANKILRALGIAKEVEVDLRAEPLQYVTGDVLILCSDGLSDLVEPGEILQIAGSHPPAQAAGQLVDLANARGGHDNITALVIRMKSSSTAREAPTLMKTMPLTAHDTPVDFLKNAAPREQGSGPTGTLVSAPMNAPAQGAPHAAQGGTLPGVMPAQPQQAAPASALVPPPVSRTSMPGGKPRAPVVILGIVLALVAVGLVGAIAFFALTPKHRTTVPFNPELGREGGSGPTNISEDLDAGVAVIAPAPTLSTEPKHYQLPRSDGGGFWDPCAALEKARARNAPPATITNLENKCRAAGGNP